MNQQPFHQQLNQLITSLPQLLGLGLAMGAVSHALVPVSSPRLLPHTRRERTPEEAETVRLIAGSNERITWAMTALKNALVYHRRTGQPFPWTAQVEKALRSLEAAHNQLEPILFALSTEEG